MIHEKGNESLKKLFLKESKENIQQLNVILDKIPKARSDKHHISAKNILHSLEGSSLQAGEHKLAYLAARMQRNIHHENHRDFSDSIKQMKIALKLIRKK
ncbi:Hpt domain-containing protein [Candidatus Woesearchaeota archaeon]|nr:Hpt domain-containing protein [Candidatus Woesearchaeota archaeon]